MQWRYRLRRAWRSSRDVATPLVIVAALALAIAATRKPPEQIKVMLAAPTEPAARRAAQQEDALRMTFVSCRDARAAGYESIPRGHPAYSRHLDRDGDGIACEPYRQ